jgi:methyl-accepting chemotaxis protein
MKKALSVALLSSLALADLTGSIQTIDVLLQKANTIDYVSRQQDSANLEEFLQRVDAYEKKFNQFVNNIELKGATPEQIEEFLNKSIELAQKTESLTEAITNLSNNTQNASPNYIHTLDALLATTLRLSDDIGVMADRIGEMADRIVYTEELIGQMADRIVHTEHLITETATNMASMITDAQTHLSAISANSYQNTASNIGETAIGANHIPDVAEGMPPAGIDSMPQAPEMPAQMPDMANQMQQMMNTMTPEQQQMMQNMMNQMMNR